MERARPDAPEARGGQKKYSDQAIETSLRIGMVYGLRGRQTEGFLASLFSLLNLTADVPDHSTVSRRGRKLGRVDIACSEGKRPVHIITDSSGLRVHVGQIASPQGIGATWSDETAEAMGRSASERD